MPLGNRGNEVGTCALKTYHVLVFVCVVRQLGHSDGSRHFVHVRGRSFDGCQQAGVKLRGVQFLPVYSRTSFTSNMVMTLPFRWLTSTSPSMLWTRLTLASISPSWTSSLDRLSSNHCLAQGETSLLTQCQLLGLCSTIVTARGKPMGGKQNLPGSQLSAYACPNQDMGSQVRKQLIFANVRGGPGTTAIWSSMKGVQVTL